MKRVRKLCIFLLWLLTTQVVAGCGENETSRPIAFVSNRSGNADIYVMSPDGSNVAQLTNHPADDIAPAWSPDGRLIAFASNRDHLESYGYSHHNFEIYTMNADGSDVIRLTDDPSFDTTPIWSPDGRRIAFVSDRGGLPHIYVMDSDGSNVIQLTKHRGAHDSAPDWSLDGRRIVFASNRVYLGNDVNDFDLYIMDIEDSSEIQLTDGPAIDSAPVWSSDGHRIMLVSDSDIYLMNTDGSNLMRLTVSNNVRFGLDGSPDDRYIVFDAHDSVRSDIYVLDAESFKVTRLTSSGNNHSPAWQP